MEKVKDGYHYYSETLEGYLIHLENGSVESGSIYHPAKNLETGELGILYFEDQRPIFYPESEIEPIWGYEIHDEDFDSFALWMEGKWVGCA